MKFEDLNLFVLYNVTNLWEWREAGEKIQTDAVRACWIQVMLVLCRLNCAEYGSSSLFYSSVAAQLLPESLRLLLDLDFLFLHTGSNSLFKLQLGFVFEGSC